ncbi:uncharacterized protein ARMOST_22032 [Armillaria ostoyae]|uniref:HAT C-terminal dimerisation domain-containing protein n=1 Tax=Armillaria ostoyae TaxID=47428 RepID=A0A284SBR1_ARMOS|nr:uncharacterized protein ARMOST_22032 [Armillaria ostoyae]
MFLFTLIPILGMVTTVVFYVPKDGSSPSTTAAGLSGIIFYVLFVLLFLINAIYPMFFHLNGLIPKAPYRFRRNHISHMRLDRFCRLLHEETTTIFVVGASESTVPMLVSDATRVLDIVEFLRHRKYIPSMSGLVTFSLYLPGRHLPLSGSDTMQDLGVTSLTHFHLRFRVHGGASADDQCALNADGTLKDASEITFYLDADSVTPLVPGPSDAPAAEALHRCGQHHKKTAKLSASLIAEQQDEDGNPVLPSVPRKRRLRKAKGKAKARADGVIDIDEDDDDYEDTDAELDDGETDTSDEDDSAIPNKELASMLPSKTIPLGGKPAEHQLRKASKTKPPKKRQHVAEEEGSTSRDTTPRVVPDSQPSTSNVRSKKKSAIHYFFELVRVDAKGNTFQGAPGDKHYRCHHGQCKIITILGTSRSNLTTLVNHLKHHFPAMHRLYMILHDRKDPPTEEEIEIANGTRKLDATSAASYLKKLELASENIIQAFQRQTVQAAGEWDQEKFKRLLLEWIVACDQPFEEVERPEFWSLLIYTHHPAPEPLNIPSRTTVQRKIMKMGEDVVSSLRQMFSELDAKVSISLDAWTSPNGYAFMAIIAHYMNNKGKLEETLIDFYTGYLWTHWTGKSMLISTFPSSLNFQQVMAFVMDNATNNDTMVEAIEWKCIVAGIQFSARESRLRCMPHTVHLAALKLLEAIGALSPSERKKAEARAGAYQDAVTSPLDRHHDEEAVLQEDSDATEEEANTHGVLTAVCKLRKIVIAVHSSPQRHKSWLAKATNWLKERAQDASETALMLILDVRTRWSSTHQMLRRACDYKHVVNTYVAINRELQQYELLTNDWEAISMVTDWLKHFRAATVEMSTTHKPMLSTVHAVFRGLQRHLKGILASLPDHTPPEIKKGLLEVHRKLSDYYYKFDESPYYTWAAHPRISYSGLKSEYSDDAELDLYLEDAKRDLHVFYVDNYASKASTSTPAPVPMAPTRSSSSTPLFGQGSPQKVSFTAHYRQAPKQSSNELNEYFALTQSREDFDFCDPVLWWYKRRNQFPNLYHMARDIMSIPGSAVAVEHIFSSSTIRTLMLVKHRLCLAHTAVEDLLGEDD